VLFWGSKEHGYLSPATHRNAGIAGIWIIAVAIVKSGVLHATWAAHQLIKEHIPGLPAHFLSHGTCQGMGQGMTHISVESFSRKYDAQK
jgi:hypothetical protein